MKIILLIILTVASIASAQDKNMVQAPGVSTEVWIALITMIGGTLATTIAAFVQIYNGRIVRKAAAGITEAKSDIVRAAVAVEDTKKEVAGMHNSVNSKMDQLIEATRQQALLEGRDLERASVAEKLVSVSQGRTEQKAASILQVAEKEARDKLQEARDKVEDARNAILLDKAISADDLKIVDKRDESKE